MHENFEKTFVKKVIITRKLFFIVFYCKRL